MLRIPARWVCASAPVALIQINNELVYICSIISAQHEIASCEIECIISITPEYASTLTAQDFSSIERHNICFINEFSSIKRRFIEVLPEKNIENSDKIQIQTPLNTYIATLVILEGPRISLYGSSDHLFASLVGKYIIVGCDIITNEGKYHVKSVELQHGYRGIALVCSTTRIKINHKPNILNEKKQVKLFGLDEQIKELNSVLFTMTERPGNWFGICIQAQEGCGALTLVKNCVNNANAILVNWSPSTIWDNKEELWNAKLIVLCIPSLDLIFPSSEYSLSRLTIRTLLHDINNLISKRNGMSSSLVLIGISYNNDNSFEIINSIFSLKITIDLPDLNTRAEILAHIRGGKKEDYMNEAHKLVGYSSSSVIEVARNPPSVYKPPMKLLKWSEIGGLNEVKNRLRRALILPRLEPEAFARFNVIPPRGILLYGPPGCAKTSLVKALCSEGYFSFIYLDSASLISAYVGESERQLREVFYKAARQTPCIVFFDEVEVIGGQRSSGSHDSDQARLLSTLLTEMDGFTASSEICFVGATNTPHLLDSALLRPGRFDYLVYVPLPPREDRRQILSLTLKGTLADLDILADATEGFSGADLSSFSSEVLLELLEGSKEGELPECLQDSNAITQLLLNRVKIFHKTSYDVTALAQFHKNHSSFFNSM